MRVMLDTNVIVSAVLFPASQLSRSVLELSERHGLVMCDKVIAELREVMGRKFSDKVQACEVFLKKLDYELALSPTDITKDVYPNIRDENDYPILAASIIANVDVFISGDGDFLASNVIRPKIMTISAFSDTYMKPEE